MAPLDARERVQICARFDELGPDAPTLCGEWTTFDLAAHLVVRERNPVGGPGIILGDRIAALARLTDKAMAREKAKGYAAVVERVRTGPPFGPFAVPVLREQINFMEYLVHHEDVRRANGMPPRDGIDDVQDAAWRFLGRGARMMIRGLPGEVRLELRRPDGATHSVSRGDQLAHVTGDPVEVVLWAYGRKQAAFVEVGGDPEAIAGLEQARYGI